MRLFLPLVLMFTVLMFQNLDAQIVINEYCPSTSAMTDEDGDTSDWLELYNCSESEVNLEGWHLSDRVSNLAKWTFPKVIMPPQSYLCVYASGKDRYEYTAGKKIYMTPLIKWGDEFAWAVGSDTIRKDWYSVKYNDSRWKRGKSGFGYGNLNAATQVPSGTMSVFVRKKFKINNLNSVEQLILDLDYDDGFVVYINGREVVRENLGTEGVEPSFAEATPNYVNPLLSNSQPAKRYIIDAFADYLVEGENVFAARIHNVSETSSDLLLIPFLTIGTTQPGGDKPDEVLNLTEKTTAKYLHTNFSLSSDGEIVYLSDPSGGIVHQTGNTPVPHNVSCGLAADASGQWQFFTEPTPESANTTQAFRSLATNQVNIEPAGGIYGSNIVVSMSSQTGAEIYYTTDGTEPTRQSKVYTEPFEVRKTTIVRAISFCDTLLPMPPATQSYLFVKRDVSLPIFSLVTDPYNLYDYNYGIYVEGPNAEDADPHYGANYHKDWERPMHLELFWPDGSTRLSQDAGVKIAGAWSRSNAQKSFAFHARNAYGNNKFDCKLFADKDISSFKSFLLRNSGNDWNSTMFRDALITGLVRNNNIDIQAYQPSVVYLNGEYWGILNIREKINEHYVVNNHNWVDPDSVDLLEYSGSVVHGDYSHYNTLKFYVRSHSMSVDTNYEYVTTQIDIDEFIEYMVLELYCNNSDWPGNNCKFWRPRVNGGRWRWILYDTDFGFGRYSNNGYEDDNLGTCLEKSSGPALFFGRLIANETFVCDLVNRFADRLNNEFKPDVVNSLIDSLSGNVSEEISYHISRWQSIGNWSSSINRMRTFAEKRPSYLRNHLRSHFSVGNDVTVTVDVSNEEAGYIQLNSLTIKDFPWRGIYFSNNPITIRAVARPGYKFVGWEEHDSAKPELTLAVKRNSSFTAVFEKSDDDYNSIVISEISYKSTEQDTRDWVELFNTTTADIDVSGWILTDAERHMDFVLPQGTVVQANGYLVVCKNKSKFMSFWPELTNVVGNFKFSLKSEGSVLLFDADGNLVDDVEYGNKQPWPKLTDGYDCTLSLANPFADNSQPMLWERSVLFGTPGALNDNYVGEPLSVDDAAQPEAFAICHPNPFADVAEITWNQVVAANVRIEIISAQGQVLADFGSKFYVEGEHSIDITQAVNWHPGLYFAKITIANSQPVIIKILRQ